MRANAANSSGVRVEKACCHIARRGLSGVLIGKGVLCERGVVVMFWVEVEWGLSFGC